MRHSSTPTFELSFPSQLSAAAILQEPETDEGWQENASRAPGISGFCGWSAGSDFRHLWGFERSYLLQAFFFGDLNKNIDQTSAFLYGPPDPGHREPRSPSLQRLTLAEKESVHSLDSILFGCGDPTTLRSGAFGTSSHTQMVGCWGRTPGSLAVAVWFLVLDPLQRCAPLTVARWRGRIRGSESKTPPKHLLNKKRPLVVASAVRHSMVWVVSRLDLVQDPTWAADSWQARPFCACALDRHAMRCPTSQYLEEHRRMWNFEFLDPHSGVPVAWFLFTTNATGQHRRRGVFSVAKDWGG